VTITVGWVIEGGWAAGAAEGCCGAAAPELAKIGASEDGFDCANDADETRRAQNKAGRLSNIQPLCIRLGR
jgi:hypothetical protein